MQETLFLLQDTEVLNALQITLPLDMPDMDNLRRGGDPAQSSAESERLALFFKFLCELSSSHCWSQMQFAMLVPQPLAAIWHDDLHLRTKALEWARIICDAVLAAEEIVYDMPGAPEISKATLAQLDRCLKDVGLNGLQLARESISVRRACQWNPADEQLRLLTHRLFARPPTTKHFLEDCFAHLADLSKRHMKGLTMQRSGLQPVRV